MTTFRITRLDEIGQGRKTATQEAQKEEQQEERTAAAATSQQRAAAAAGAETDIRGGSSIQPHRYNRTPNDMKVTVC